MPRKTSKTLLIRLALSSALLAAGLTYGGVSASAHEGASGVVKQRMDLMERFDELMDRIFAMFNGEIPYHAATMRKAASEIRDKSGNHLTALFPQGSDQKPSKVSPAIWSEFGRFSHMADMLQAVTDNLAQQAERAGGEADLPRKWEEVRMGPGMMGRGMGMMGGMHGQADAWRIAGHAAAMCNACHDRFKKKD